MKKIYAILVLMLAFCGFSANAQTVTKIGDAISDVSTIKEGDYLAFESVDGSKFLFTQDYFDGLANYYRLRFKNSDFYGAMGTDASMQYVYKVVGLSAGSFKLQAHTGGYVPVLNNSKPGGANYIADSADEAETFRLVAASSTTTWYVEGAEGPRFTIDSWKERLQGTDEGTEFKIYKAELGEATAKVGITFQFFDEEFNEIQADQTQQYSIGGKVTVPTIRYNWSFVRGSDINDETKTVAPGDQIEVTAEATYQLIFKPWPTLTINFVDAAGTALTDKDGNPSSKTVQVEPGVIVPSYQFYGAPEGYYISQDVMAALQNVMGPEADSTVNVVCSRSTIVTVHYVDENGVTIRESITNPTEPGWNLSYENVEWYALTDEDQAFADSYVVGTTDTVITLHHVSKFPFEATTIVDGAFAEGTKWYGIQYQVGSNYDDYGYPTTISYEYMFYEEGSPCCVAPASEVEDAMLWAFVGNAQDGFALYNKEAGASMKLHVDAKEINDMSTGLQPMMNADNGTKFLVKQSYTGAAVFGIGYNNQYTMPCYATLCNLAGEGTVAILAGLWGGLNDFNAMVTIVPEAEVTGIEAVETAAPAQTDGAIYDLSGRRVENPGKGLYIQNGKVVLK